MFTTELRYVIVRYMLNELGDEASNVGLIAVLPDPARTIVRFLDDPTTKSRSDVRIQKDSVRRFQHRVQDLAHRMQGNDAVDVAAKGLFAGIGEYCSGLVRLSSPRSVLTNDPTAEVDRLFAQWVQPVRVSSLRRETAARDPLSGMRKEASRAIVRTFRDALGRPLSRKSYRRSFEVRGQSHTNRFDLAHVDEVRGRPRAQIFHHLLVLPGAEESFDQVAALCWRWADVRSQDLADQSLTAVAYARRSDSAKMLQEATRLLKKNEIQLASIEDLPLLVRRLDGQGELI